MTLQQLKAPITTQDLNHSVLTLIWQLAGLALVVVIAVVFLSSKWPKQTADVAALDTVQIQAGDDQNEGGLFAVQTSTASTNESENISVPHRNSYQPERQVLCSGHYNGKIVIFNGSPDAKILCELHADTVYTYPTRENGEYVGGETIDFKAIKDVCLIKQFEAIAFEFINYLVSNDGYKVWISYTVATPDEDEFETGIIEWISIDGSESQQVWNFRQCRDCFELANASGMLWEQPDESHLAFIIADCYACSPTHHAYIILNTKTLAQQYLEMVGDVKFNRSAQTVSYRKISLVEEVCPTDSPVCSPGEMWKVDRPTGEVITEPLP